MTATAAIEDPPSITGVDRPVVMHVTTTDMSLDWLMRPQLEAFVEAGFEVVGVSGPGPHVAALEASGITHVAVRHLTRAMRPGQDMAAFAELRRIFIGRRPDIVHTHNPKPGILGRLAARSAGVPVVINTVHGLYAQPGDGLVRRALVYGMERTASACSDLELVQNPEDVDVLARIGVPADRIRLLGNGVDLRRFRVRRFPDRDQRRSELGIRPGAVVCGVVGRLVREKGYDQLLEAAERLSHTAPDVVVVVVGPVEPDKADAVDPDRMARARRAGVVFLGQRTDVEDLYPLFDLYLLASHREGFPRSAMEAAACGLPLIVTDIRGGRQVVDDGVTGRLIPVRDPRAIEDAVTELADDPARRRQWGRAGAAKAVAEFDQQSQIAVTLDAYRRLLGP